MIEASRRLGILDVSRVPYTLSDRLPDGDWERLRAVGGGCELRWPKRGPAAALYSVEGVPFVGSVRPDR